MSLYTFSTSEPLPARMPVQGLHIEECTDLTLLAIMGQVTKEEVVRRLAADNLAFTAFVRGQPAAFGWMARSKANIGELAHDFVLPIRNRYLWNFRTMPAFRGRGIYPLLLQFIITFERPRAERFWIIHAPENKASLKGIIKAGFSYTGKLYPTSDGRAGFEPSGVSKQERKLITAMGFHASDAASASCWNCSSPYLKTKQAVCCCTSAGTACTLPQA
ncbi:MAG TPA: N-acetyltransferase [Chitinophagaceae bacterium]|jgi:GNAT superfamily N-acetyltransferase|nr:N-acetyltransferase [Chitinophagaceae bacterium]